MDGHRNLRSRGITECPPTAITVTRGDRRDDTDVRYPPICSPVRSTAVAVDDAPKEQYVTPETGPWGLSSFLAGFLAVGPQTVTCPPNRVDDGLTELAAQVPHVHVDEVRPGIEVHAPGHGQ